MPRGYAEMTFAWHDYDLDQPREGGARSDSRLVFDTARFTFELEGFLPLGLQFEVEAEFEHRGAGAAMELDYEEFGEYEQEVEAGGEVVLEELYLAKTFGPVRLRVGRFYLAVGLLSELFRPTEYLASTRPESETLLLPGVWDEMGFDATLTLPSARFTLQLVNGLDSTGFNSKSWIAGGHQRRFELVRASDLALVARADWLPTPRATLGVSAYYGATSRNRPKADLVPDCPGADPGAVASCGYVSANVLLLDAHFILDLDPFVARGTVLWGRLDNAEAVSERNARLSNNLNVARTPVADEAFFAWLELGWDLSEPLGLPKGHHLEPYLRYEYLDTMFATSGDTFDNPRFARAITTVGLGYSYGDLMFAKLDFSRRDVGAYDADADFAAEHSLTLATGFTY